MLRSQFSTAGFSLNNVAREPGLWHCCVRLNGASVNPGHCESIQRLWGRECNLIHRIIAVHARCARGRAYKFMWNIY